MNENTQHPLTDEQMRAIQAAPGDFFTRLRAAFDAGREHERTTPADPHHDPRPWQDCTRKDIRKGDLVEAMDADLLYVGVAHHQDKDGDWLTEKSWALTWGTRWPLRRIPAHTTEKDTPMTETPAAAEPLARTLLAVPAGHGAPHHDAGKIKFDDIVLQVDKDGTLRGGLAHHQDRDGNWCTENDHPITWVARRADRPDALTVWPASTPPAEEVELPTEHPAHLRNVEGVDGAVCAYMALERGGSWCGVDEDGRFRIWGQHGITACTLPDGTRIRRDGEHPDGTPRFVKTQEEEA